MKGKLLLDSNIFVDYLRGRTEALEYFDNLKDTPAISAITVAELFAGVREGKERELLDQIVPTIDVVAVTVEIAMLGGLFRRQYMKSHRLDIADAVIAATADREKLRLVTLNRKHFPMFGDVITPY